MLSLLLASFAQFLLRLTCQWHVLRQGTLISLSRQRAIITVWIRTEVGRHFYLAIIMFADSGERRKNLFLFTFSWLLSLRKIIAFAWMKQLSTLHPRSSIKTVKVQRDKSFASDYTPLTTCMCRLDSKDNRRKFSFVSRARQLP